MQVVVKQCGWTGLNPHLLWVKLAILEAVLTAAFLLRQVQKQSTKGGLIESPPLSLICAASASSYIMRN